MAQPFDKNYTKLDDQAVRRGDPVSAGTLGPFAPANSNPLAYRNNFISELKKNPPANQFYQQAFSAKSARGSQDFINGLTNQPLFKNPGEQQIATDFLQKYARGAQRGLINEPISQQSIAFLQTQAPGQGIGGQNVNAAHRMNYPGASGTQLS